MARNRLTVSKQYTIIDYKKNKNIGRKILFILAILLIAAGIVLLLVTLGAGIGRSVVHLFVSATPTSTPTETFTPTPEFTATFTPTPTPLYTDTPTPSPTPDGPHEYIVEEGDNCWYIAVDKFGVSFDVFMAINNLKDCSIKPGDRLIVPGRDQKLPTSVPGN